MYEVECRAADGGGESEGEGERGEGYEPGKRACLVRRRWEMEDEVEEAGGVGYGYFLLPVHSTTIKSYSCFLGRELLIGMFGEGEK